MADSSNQRNEATNGGQIAMELNCLKGDWGIPSVDRKCLNILTYGQFAGASLKVKNNGNLWRNPSGHFPVFRAAQEVLKSDTQVIKYFQDNQLDLDEELTDQQRADVLAFQALMEEKFLPGLLHVWWIDAKNYVEFTRPWYAKALQFPLNYFIPGRWHREAELRVEETRGGSHMEPQEVTNRVCSDAKECLNLLSVRLGEEDFFFGKVPTSLDALIFSYIAPLLRAPLPSNQLQMHLKGADNLCSFCSRILLRYFPEEPQGTQQSTSKTSTDDSFDDPHKRRNQVLAALFALTAMVSYAFMNGLVRLQVTDSGDGGIELEYEEEDDKPN
ncbi:metaxin-1-like [Asterias amurensis]|uniref:metaxin-1-like n=1 Tax=Asterias amurensis TaxID=7602 RepID=UPI003AB16F17